MVSSPDEIAIRFIPLNPLKDKRGQHPCMARTIYKAKRFCPKCVDMKQMSCYALSYSPSSEPNHRLKTSSFSRETCGTLIDQDELVKEPTPQEQAFVKLLNYAGRLRCISELRVDRCKGNN